MHVAKRGERLLQFSATAFTLTHAPGTDPEAKDNELIADLKAPQIHQWSFVGPFNNATSPLLSSTVHLKMELNKPLFQRVGTSLKATALTKRCFVSHVWLAQATVLEKTVNCVYTCLAT